MNSYDYDKYILQINYQYQSGFTIKQFMSNLGKTCEFVAPRISKVCGPNFHSQIGSFFQSSSSQIIKKIMIFFLDHSQLNPIYKTEQNKKPLAKKNLYAD